MSLKSNLQMALMLSLLTAILLGIGLFFGGITGMTIGLGIALVINFVSYWYSDKFVLWIYGAKKANEKDYPELSKILEKLSKKADIPKPPLYIMKTDVPNAFATGRSHKHSAVAVTTGLMKKLNYREIEGVLAHEISHIKHRDTLLSTMAATLAGAITWIAYIFFYGDDDNRNIFSFLFLFILAPIAASLVRLAISRNREYLADRGGAEISNGDDLASALEKISSDVKASPAKGNPSAAHVFIVNPFKGSSVSSLFSTHPPVEERVKRLRSFKKEKA